MKCSVCLHQLQQERFFWSCYLTVNKLRQLVRNSCITVCILWCYRNHLISLVEANVTSVVPQKGPDSGNTPLLITGFNFLNTETTYCNFSNGAVFQTVQATNITSTSLSCISPPLCTRTVVPGCLQLTAVVDVQISVTNNNLQYGDTSVDYEYFGTNHNMLCCCWHDDSIATDLFHTTYRLSCDRWCSFNHPREWLVHKSTLV